MSNSPNNNNHNNNNDDNNNYYDDWLNQPYYYNDTHLESTLCPCSKTITCTKVIDLLTNNIVLLSNIKQNNLITLQSELFKSQKHNEELTVQLTTEKRKRLSLQDEIMELEEDKQVKKQKFSNKYETKYYKKNRDSYSDDKINEIFNNLKTIKDIIKLKKDFKYYRHINKLQKLYNTIPALEKLNDMIGLNDLKNDLFKVIIYYVQNNHTDEYLHTIIQGPPGVGKTEFSKIYADIFVRLGILKSDSFIEIKKDDLVAKYLGQTSHRTKELLERGMGGVIFLDEAYSLGNAEKRDSFAKEAIDMINQYLSERKNEFMFIIAGYEEDLDACFFSFNRGLKRRFSHKFTIEKYNEIELAEIFKLKMINIGYVIDTETLPDNKYLDFFKKNYKKFENFAGDIERLSNYIKYEQSFRCFKSNKNNKVITIDDLVSALGKFKESNKYEPPMGMYV